MLHRSKLAEHLSRAGIVTAVLIALPASAQAADLAQEVQTAATHAGLAAQGAGIEQVHMHLHHVVNCLVGPNGPGFDAEVGNPCQKFGDGAIPDAADQALKAKLNAALGKAQAGLKSDDLAAARKAGTEAQAALK